MFIGSNTEKTIASLNIPVLITKKDDSHFKFKKFVFASTFENDEIRVFEEFLKFSKFFKCKIYLLKIITPQNFENTTVSKQKIKHFIEKYELDNYTICVYNDKSVVDEVLNFSREEDVDLISLATHGRTGIAKFFNNSVSLDLSKNVLKPVLTFKV